MAQKYISVFIPTYNGEKYIGELLDAVLHQELPAGYKLECIVIDSGSSDTTVEIIKKHYAKKVAFSEIPNSEFGHGKTRQKAAEMAKGEYILFLSQDATPTTYQWIKHMIAPFLMSDKVGCVFGRQIPRPSAVPTIKREVATVFGQLGASDGVTLSSENSFFSDVNSAIRKDLVQAVPFRDLAYAEDQALARDMQAAGYLKAYTPQGSVWHSNEYSVGEFYGRKFDEYIGLIDSVNYKLQPSLKSLFLGWIRPFLADIRFTLRDQDYSKKRKLKYLVLALGYNINAARGKYAAAKYHTHTNKRRELSLEAQRKTKNND